jgi:hypothetical protein
MFTITLKRSAATLGVVAGLLAAAAPAGAQILDGPIMWGTPRANLNALGTQVGSEGLKAPKAAGTETGNPEIAHRSDVLDTGMFEHSWLMAPAED